MIRFSRRCSASRNSGLPQGVYEITVRDAGGCASFVTDTIESLDAYVVSLRYQQVDGCAPIEVCFEITGGTEAYILSDLESTDGGTTSTAIIDNSNGFCITSY